MGAQLSCDVCDNTLNEDKDMVYERTGANPQHVCVVCYQPEVHNDYCMRTVYAVCGEENARRVNKGIEDRDPTIEQTVRLVREGFSDTVLCKKCGMENVRESDATSCFACETPFANAK